MLGCILFLLAIDAWPKSGHVTTDCAAASVELVNSSLRAEFAPVYACSVNISGPPLPECVHMRVCELFGSGLVNYSLTRFGAGDFSIGFGQADAPFVSLGLGFRWRACQKGHLARKYEYGANGENAHGNEKVAIHGQTH